MLGRALRVGVVVAALALAVAMRVPLCPFALVTRHPCPGCGLTRAALALAHLDVATALRFHPLAPVLVPLLGLAMTYNAARYVVSGSWFATESLNARWATALAVALAIALIGVWVARFFGAFGGPVPV